MSMITVPQFVLFSSIALNWIFLGLLCGMWCNYLDKDKQDKELGLLIGAIFFPVILLYAIVWTFCRGFIKK